MAVVRLRVEADGPLSVRCETCGEVVVTATQNPTTSYAIPVLLALRKIHARVCVKAGESRG